MIAIHALTCLALSAVTISVVSRYLLDIGEPENEPAVEFRP